MIEWIQAFFSTMTHPMAPNPENWIHGAMVGVAYFLQLVMILLVIHRGYRHKTYGMPFFGVVTWLSLAFICGFIGPQLEPHLFGRLIDVAALLWMWRAITLIMLVCFAQCVLTRWKEPFEEWPGLRKLWIPYAIGVLVLMTYFEWTFIIFYQDYYINEVWPLVNLVVAVAFLSEFVKKPSHIGFSVGIALTLVLSNILLYAAVVLGTMSDPYPCHDGSCNLFCSEGARLAIPDQCVIPTCTLQFDTGYSFIYLVYGVTIGLNLAYMVGLIGRRARLGAPPDGPAPV